MQTPNDGDKLTCIFCKGEATFHEKGKSGDDYIACGGSCGNVYYWLGLPDRAKINILVETQRGNSIIWICGECLGDNESLTIGRVLDGKDPCPLCSKVTDRTDLHAIRNPAYTERKNEKKT